MPVASARSFCGNHIATALMDAGKLAASATPRMNRMMTKPTTVATRPCAGSRDGPEDQRDRQRLLYAEAIDKHADGRRKRRICEGECERDPRVIDIVPSERALQRGLQYRQRVAVDVVDRRAEEQQPADHPPIVSDGTGVILRVVGTHSADPPDGSSLKVCRLFLETRTRAAAPVWPPRLRAGGVPPRAARGKCNRCDAPHRGATGWTGKPVCHR